MIKKIVLIAAMGTMGLLWGSGDVTIQVINAVKEKSITHDFEKKLEKSGLPIHKVVEGGRYIVTLGSYKDAKSAQTALKKARSIVCKEAFIRPVNRDQIAATPHEPAKTVHAAAVAVSTHHEIAKVETPVAQHAEVKAVVQAPVVAKEPNVLVVEVKPVTVEVKNSPAVVAKSETQAASEKKEAHISEIAQAINFYKNSPYHRFEPVKLHQ